MSESDLEIVLLPALSNVTGDVRIYSNDDLAEVRMPALEVIGGDLEVSQHQSSNQLSGGFDMSSLRLVSGRV